MPSVAVPTKDIREQIPEPIAPNIAFVQTDNFRLRSRLSPRQILLLNQNGIIAENVSGLWCPRRRLQGVIGFRAVEEASELLQVFHNEKGDLVKTVWRFEPGSPCRQMPFNESTADDKVWNILTGLYLTDNSR